MLNHLIQQISGDLQTALGNSATHLPKRELEQLLQGSLRQLNLVTREEFDAQTAVLQRSREKLDALEKALEQLQQKQQP